MGFKEIKSGLSVLDDGTVLTSSTYEGTFAIKVLSSVYMEQTGKRHYVTEYGEVRNNKFISSSTKDSPDLTLRTIASVAGSFKYTWTEDKTEVKSGDVLKDESGNFYLVASEDVVWNLNRGTYASYGYWKDNKGKLTMQNVSTYTPYSKFIEVKDKM